MPYDTSSRGCRQRGAHRALRPSASDMTTSYRNIFLLACCQALLLTNAAGLISMNGLVGYSLVDDQDARDARRDDLRAGLRAVDDADVAVDGAGSGRRRGFMTGALINIGGCALAVARAVAAQLRAVLRRDRRHRHLQRRSGCSTGSPPRKSRRTADKARAISLVLAGGIVGGFLGPAITRWGKDLFATPFLGSFLLLAVVALRRARRAVAGRRADADAPRRAPAADGRLARSCGSPCSSSRRWPAALGYGLMNLLMTATPLAMDFCGHPYSQAAMVISWHVVGMYAPGFVTGIADQALRRAQRDPRRRAA